MRLRLGNPLTGYGLAVVFVALAFAGRLALSPIIGEAAPFLLFILAALLSAVFGGIGPGLLAMVAGQLLGHYFFTVPRHALFPVGLLDWVYWSLYTVVTLFCIALVEALHKATAKAQDSITRAQRHEDQLRTIIREMTAAQERIRELASVVESADDAIFSMSLDGTIKSWNQGAERLLGFAASEMIGASLSRIIPEGKGDEHAQLMARVAVGESPAAIETVRLSKSGYLQEVSIRCSPIKDVGGNIVGVSAISRDISSAKRAEAEIKRLNRDLRHHLRETREVMQVLPVGLAISYTPDCNSIALNPVLAEMLGMEESELLTDDEKAPFCMSEGGMDRSFSSLPLRIAALENREIRDWEAKLQRVDGSTLDVLAQAAPLHDEEGRVRGVIGAVVDISDLKRAHAALQETELRFRIMADNAPLMIWMTDVLRQSVWVNKTWRVFTGRPNEVEDPEGWAEPLHTDDVGMLKETMESAEHKGESFEVEFRLRKHDGEWRWMLARGVPRYGLDGTFLGYIASCMDVTDWKQAEEALENKFDELRQAQLALRAQNEELASSRRDLENERARYRELFDSAPVGYIITSRQGVIQQVNNAAAEMLEESPAFLQGFPFARLLARQDRATFFANIGRLSRREATCVQDWEAGVMCRTRPDFPCSISVNLIEDGERRISGLRWILRDVTERKEAEQRVIRLNAELEQRVQERTAALEAANRELEAFSYSVSHDLRAPLRSVEGFTKAVLEDYRDKLDDQGVKFLSYARESSVRMGHLIQDLLELSRASRGELRCERFDLSSLCQSVIADLHSRTPRKVRAVVQPGIWAIADIGLLRIALENLLSNAWKFTEGRDPATVEVGFTTHNEKACVFVRDNGAGFNMANVGRLFGAFQRLHTQRDFPGTGIGLATVKRIVVRHSGAVWAESKVNEGASFYFALPELGCESPPKVTEPRLKQPATPAGERPPTESQPGRQAQSRFAGWEQSAA